MRSFLKKFTVRENNEVFGIFTWIQFPGKTGIIDGTDWAPCEFFMAKWWSANGSQFFSKHSNVNGDQKFIRWLHKNQISWCDRASRRHWLVTVQNLYTKTFHTDHNSLLRFRWSPRQKYHFKNITLFQHSYFSNSKHANKKKNIMVDFQLFEILRKFYQKVFQLYFIYNPRRAK